MENTKKIVSIKERFGFWKKMNMKSDDFETELDKQLQYRDVTHLIADTPRCRQPA